MLGKLVKDLTGPAREMDYDDKEVCAMELVESCREGIPYVKQEDTGMSLLALAFGLVSLCSCCAGIAASRMTTDCCKKRKTTTSTSTQTEPEKIEPAVEFRNAKPLPGGRSM